MSVESANPTVNIQQGTTMRTYATVPLLMLAFANAAVASDAGISQDLPSGESFVVKGIILSVVLIVCLWMIAKYGRIWLGHMRNANWNENRFEDVKPKN